MTTVTPAPTATGYVTGGPCPRIVATFTPPAGVVTVTVLATSSAGKWWVRAAIRKPVPTGVGPMGVTDYEAPFGTPVTYSVVGYDAAGVPSPESAASNAVTLNVSSGCPWVSDPSNPSASMTWTVAEWAERSYARAMTALTPLASDQAIVITGRRSLPASEIEVITRSGSEAATMRALADTPVVQLRTPTSWVWRGGYFAIGELTETPLYFDATDPTQTWHAELIPTSRPDPALFFPIYTWSTIKAMYATWGALGSSKATWLDVMLNPDPGAG